MIPQAPTQTHPAPTVLLYWTNPPFSYKLEQKQIKPYNIKKLTVIEREKKGFTELFSSCFLLDLHKRVKGAYQNMLTAHEELDDSGLRFIT